MVKSVPKLVTTIILLMAGMLFSSSAQAACSWTTLSNGTTANATQVMNNFDCLAPLASPAFTGNVGIGTTGPDAKLRVDIYTIGDGLVSKFINADGSGYSSYLYIGSSPGTDWKIGKNVLNAASNADFNIVDSSSNDRLHIKSANGNVGIGTASPGQKLDVAGTIRQSNCTTAGTLSTNASGDIICTSDARLKNVLGEYIDGLNAITQITPRRFTYKPTATNPSETFVHAGFIAQDVKRAIPQAVALQHSGYYSLDTTAILAASVNAIKELKAANDRQAIEIRQLKSQMNTLQRKFATKVAQNR